MASSLAVQTVGSAACLTAASAKASVAGKASAATPLRAFSGLKQQNALCTPSKGFASQTVSNGSRVQAMQDMQVWTPINNKKFETLSYLPPLSPQQILRQVDYLLAQGWSPCIEFDNNGFIYREHHTSPGYYDGRYWTMWKLPLFGCQNANEVLNEVEECKKAFPGTYVRVLGFNRKRQVQAAGFIVYKPNANSSAQSSSAFWQATPQSPAQSSNGSWEATPRAPAQNSFASWENTPSFWGEPTPEAPAPTPQAPAPTPKAPTPTPKARAPARTPKAQAPTPTPQAPADFSSRSWDDVPSFWGEATPEAPAPTPQAPADFSSRSWEDTPSFWGEATPEAPAPTPQAPADFSSRNWEDIPSFWGEATPEAPAPTPQAPAADFSSRNWEDTPGFFG